MPSGSSSWMTSSAASATTCAPTKTSTPVLKDVRKRFKFMGDTGAYYWLYVLGEEVPDYSEFCNRGK